MARTAKEGVEKKTYRLSKEVIASLERIAALEGRTTTAQLERFLAEKVREYEQTAKQRVASVPS